jgi:ubiquinone biosynthesis protein
MQLQEQQLESLRREVRRANRRTYGAILGGSLILSATILSALDGYAKIMVGNLPLYSWILGSIGVAVLLAAWPNHRDD